VYQCVLFCLAIGVRFGSLKNIMVNFAGFIQKATAFDFFIGIDSDELVLTKRFRLVWIIAASRRFRVVTTEFKKQPG
jgi:hypothetical protein